MSMKVPPFRAGELEQICQVLAATETGLTGSQLERLLRQIKVSDPTPTMTKWKRLYNALSGYQNRTGSGGKVLSFVSQALDPVRYRGQTERFEELRDGVNVVLAFRGLEFREDGKFHRVRGRQPRSAKRRRWQVASGPLSHAEECMRMFLHLAGPSS